MLLRRVADISGNLDADDQEFERKADDDPLADGDAAPEAVRAILARLRPGVGPGESGFFRVPYVDADELG